MTKDETKAVERYRALRKICPGEWIAADGTVYDRDSRIELMEMVADAFVAVDPKPPGYVVYYVESLRDGTEESAKAFGCLENAMAFINEPFFGRGNYTFRLFTLGVEVPLEAETISEPQPPKTATRLKAKAPTETQG